MEAFDNEAKPPLKTDDLIGLDAAKIRLQLQPHLTLLKLENEVDDFLIELKKNSGLRSEASNAMEQNQRRKKTQIAHATETQNKFSGRASLSGFGLLQTAGAGTIPAFVRVAKRRDFGKSLRGIGRT